MPGASPDFDSLFAQAIALASPAERAAFIAQNAGHDPQLKQRLERLVEAHFKAGSFLASSPTADAPAATEDSSDRTVSHATETHTEPPVRSIGPYKLLEPIGEGGMGTVYLAEQTAPVKRLVALKLIKPGMDSRQVLARFEAERQALALMDHPHIAKVLDAGTTEQGRPYFVMELVKGQPITRYCDDRKLTPRERLELFIPVCQAVQHAHQKGIIHRDLKPSNVLVGLYDGVPLPKVIDFGIAKATGQKLTEATLFTGFGAVVGTPEYMSPEQAQLDNLDIDTRSDVYSLGVLLYELLTGTTPIDRKRLKQAALLEILRVIREEDPQRPSTRLSTTEELPSIAASRNVEPRKLSSLVRGELDWIVMKALEKDRNRRYDTATNLAADLRRYLDDDQVQACPPSAAYRLKKLARRHRVALSVGLIVSTVLIAATAFSTWQAIRATRAQKDALESAEIQRQTTGFFILNLLGMSDLNSQVIGDMPPDPNLKVRTLVDRAAKQIDGQFPDRPLIEAAVRQMIAQVYGSLNLLAEGRRHIQRAYEIRRQELGLKHHDTINSQTMLAMFESGLTLQSQAEARLRGSLDLAIQWHGEESDLANDARRGLAGCLISQERFAEAEVLLRSVIEQQGRGRSVDRFIGITARNNLARALTAQGEEAEAEKVIAEGLREAEQHLGENHPLVPNLLGQLSRIQTARGRLAEGYENAQKALDLSRKLYSDHHPTTLFALKTLESNLTLSDRFEEAETIARSCYEVSLATYGEDTETTIETALDLVSALHRRGRDAEAEALLLKLRESARRIGSRLVDSVDERLASIYSSTGKYAEAIQLYQSLDEKNANSPTANSRQHLILKTNLAYALSSSGHVAESVEVLRAVMALAEKSLGPDDFLTFEVTRNLAGVYRQAGLLEESQALYPRVLAIGQRILGSDHSGLQIAHLDFGALLHVRGRFQEAETEYRAALDGLRRTLGPTHEKTQVCISNLGELYRDWGKPDQGEPLLREAFESMSNSLGPDQTATLWPLWKLAEMERDRGQVDSAEAKFLRCLNVYDRAQGAGGLDNAMLRADLAMNYRRKGESARAEVLFREALGVFDRAYPDHWRRFEIQSQLGEILADQHKYDEAEPLLLTGHEGLTARWNQVTVDAWPRRPESGTRLVRLYEAWGKPETAERWRKQLRSQELSADKPDTRANSSNHTPRAATRGP